MLNQNIKNLRKQKGYTQETFAQELNVVRQTVSKWEKGYSVPDALMLEKIAELLDVSVADLLGNTEGISDSKSELQMISDQLSILNNQFAKELAGKKKKRKIAVISLIVILALAAVLILIGLVPLKQQEVYPDGETAAAVGVRLDSELDKAVSEAIMKDNDDSSFGECATVSSFIFGKKETDDTVTVYLIEDYSRFGFCCGYFTNVSGANTPVVFTFKKAGDDYKLISGEAAKDGADYAPSVKKLFPNRYAKMILNGLSDEQNEKLWNVQLNQAKEYLKSIGRDETVCKYGDIMIEQLSDYGVSQEAVNKICGMKSEYDYTIGNHEKTENGIRYVYQTGYDESNDLVTFTKFEHSTNNIAEFFALDAQTGETVKNAQKPQKAVYYKAALKEDND